MRISDWSSDVCSSDLTLADAAGATDAVEAHWCAGAGVPDQQRAWRNRDGGRDTAPEQSERDARRGENPPLRRDVAAKISHCRSPPATRHRDHRYGNGYGGLAGRKADRFPQSGEVGRTASRERV